MVFISGCANRLKEEKIIKLNPDTITPNEDGLIFYTEKIEYSFNTLNSEFKAFVKNKGNMTLFYLYGCCVENPRVYKKDKDEWINIRTGDFNCEAVPDVGEIKPNETLIILLPNGFLYINNTLQKKGEYRLQFSYSINGGSVNTANCNAFSSDYLKIYSNIFEITK